MAAGFEHREHDPCTAIWVGKYRNLQNMPHWHWEYELIACQSGSASLTLDGNLLTLSAGTAAFCPSGSVHHIHSSGDTLLIVAQIDPKLLRFLGDPCRLAQPVFEDHYRIFESIDEILKELQLRQPYYAQRAEAVMTQLCIDIFRSQAAVSGPRTVQTTAAAYRDLLSAMDRDYEFITFTDAASRMHMSKGYFSRYFKHMAGMTFSEYLNLVKVDKAVTMLKAEPELLTSELAIRCGFNTLRSFNRIFRSVTGFSPKQLPPDYSLHIRQYAVRQKVFDPTLSESVPL